MQMRYLQMWLQNDPGEGARTCGSDNGVVTLVVRWVMIPSWQLDSLA